MAPFRGVAFAAVMALASRFMTTAAGSADSSRLQIHIPKSLTKSGGYDHREALFGVPPYGGSLQQSLYYADNDLCDAAQVDTRAGYPIRPKDKDGKMEPWPSPYILMVDRGGCSFVTKVRNAQRSGAAGVIIADNTCLCTAGDSCFSDPGVECEPQEPIMADDGSGSDISIPSFLMFKQDADPVKAELRANHMIRIEMTWALPSPDDRVEYDLWTTPTELVSRDFQKTFKDAAVALGSHAYFTPHMYIYDGIKSGCQGPEGENMCYNLCTNNGRYCATDPDNDLDQGISGADVVQESLRRACIWNQHGKEDGIGGPWWDYVNEFMFRCDTEEYFTNEDCVKDAMSHASVDHKTITACMSDSGGLEQDTTNNLLEEQIAAQAATGVVILPAAYVNSADIRGALTFSTVFKAICAGFLAGTSPPVCDMCANCKDEHACVVNGFCEGSGKGAVSNTTFIASLVTMAFVFAGLAFIQWKRSQRQVRDQVRGILADYMPLDDEGRLPQSTAISEEEDGEFT